MHCEIDSIAICQPDQAWAAASKVLRRLDFWLLAGSLLCYFVLACAIARTKAPWVDEGWVASAPANWAQTGGFGTPGLEPSGSWVTKELTGINQYTYWNLPVGITLQGLWFKLVGFTVFKMRLIGILFGALALISWSAIVTKLSGIRIAGPLTTALLAVDYTFVWVAADGRMDMICLALGVSGLAAYLLLSESRWTLSLWLANTAMALALFTHPNGLMFPLLLIFLLLYYDRQRVAWKDLATTTPYFAVAALWGLYILRRPDYFIAQFAANASARSGSRFEILVHPLKAVLEDLYLVLGHYHFHPYPTPSVPHYAILIPFIYGLAFLVVWLMRPMRHDRDRLALLCIGTLQLAFLTFMVGLKLPTYLVFPMPFFAALIVVGIYLAFRNGSVLSWGSVIIAGLLVACQLGTAVSFIRLDQYHRDYLPTAQFVRQKIGSKKGTVVVADSFFGFELGLGRVKDDSRLGFYSGLRPDIIVEGPFYTELMRQLFNAEEPEVTLYVRALLGTEYRLVFSRGQYRVYERRTEGL